MRKRVLAIVLAIVMLVGIIPTTFVFASESTATLTVIANKSVVHPGDVIEFSVELTQTGDIAAIEAYVDLPAGLTLVDGSFAAATDKSTLGWDDFTVDEDYLMVYGYGSKGYTETSTTLATFKCVVDADAEGTLVVDLYDVSALDAMMDDKNPTSVSATMNVEIPVTGVTLDKDTLALNTGDNKTATLTATVAPNKATNKAVTWKSSDESVATVVDGVVTAVKFGTATVTVETVDGGFTAICVVTVECAHTSKTHTDAKTADCQQGGWNEYYTCDDCNQLFDADAMTKIDSVPTTDIDATNHTNEKDFDADEATCVHQGNDAYTKCLDCGVVTAGSDVKYYGEHNYGELKVASTEIHTATELKPAVAAHYQCSVCQKYFTEGKIETTLEALTGTTPSHSYGDWVNTDASKHWKECACGKQIENADHDFDNTCDTTCNTCGYVRTITHTWGDTWYTDGENHWKECSVCHNARTEEGAHTGGTATCQTVRECTVCHLNYGDLAGCDFVEYVADEYLVTEATCVSEAVYKKSCSVCGSAHETETFKHGTVDATNHVGGTYIEGDKKSDCVTPGYTGDIKCNSCHQVITYGTELPLASHVPASNWSTDGTHHWKECMTVGCDHKIDKNEHTGGTATCKDKAVCEVCMVEYGAINAANHVGGTEIRDAAPATCDVPGYTGDTWCKGCNTKIEDGEVIPAAHKTSEVSANPATHESAGNIKHYVCTECDKLFADADAKTEIEEKDTVLPKGEHNYGDTYKTDTDNHWKECECGDKIELGAHTGGTATCQTQKECTVCKTAYGEFSACDYVEVVDEKYLVSEATCVAEAVYKKSCSVCGTAHATETFKNGTVDATNHVGGTYVEGKKESTCVVAGYSGDTKCNSCHAVVTPGTNLPIGSHRKASSWSTNGTYHWKYCRNSGCAKIFSKSEHSGGTATCCEKAACEVCNVEYGNLDANNHNGATVIKNAKAATCEENGYTGDTYCKDCNAKIKSGETIPATHNLTEITAVGATHETAGNVAYYSCSDCEKLFTDAEAVTEITAEDTVVPVVEHTYGDWNVTKESTTEEAGSKEKVCTDCGHKVVEELPVVEPVDTEPQPAGEGFPVVWVIIPAVLVCGLVVLILLVKKKSK